MKLANISLNTQTVLAPLAGISDMVFRSLCKEQGAGLVYSEMVSADGLVREDRKTFQYIEFSEKERPIAIQLFGSDPAVMYDASQILEKVQPDFIDINFGCPVKKVVKRGAGAALLKDIPLLCRIALAVKKATTLPVLAKIRSGWDHTDICAIEVAQKLVECGISAITVHPRTQTQQFQGHSDWSLIKQIKQTVSIPVIGNGDIISPACGKKMLEETACDFLMIGRGALGNPWIFQQMNSYLANGSYSLVSNNQRLTTCLRHLKLTLKYRGYQRGIREMRKHIAWYVKGLPNSTYFRSQLFKITEVEHIEAQLIQYFKNLS